MIYRKTFRIESWKDWDHCIDMACKEFHILVGIFPNIFRANRVTLQRIDIVASKEKITHMLDGAKCGKYQCVNIGGFVGNGYDLDFCVDDCLRDKEFSLLYDAHPDGDDGEPIPKEDNVEGVISRDIVKAA